MPSRARLLILRLVMVAAVAAVYANSLPGVFLFDDMEWIVRNDELHVLWPPTVAMGLTLRPVAFYSFALNHAVSGHDVWSYHVVNVALHALTALSLFGCVRRLLGASPEEGSDGRATALAFGASLLWAVHPLNTQAVTYIVQRAEVLAGLAYLLVLYAFLRSVQADGVAARRRWTVAAMSAFYAGLGCKETIVTAPAAVLLLDVLVVTRSIRAALRLRWAFHAALWAPFLVVPLWWLIVSPERFVLLTPNAAAPGRLEYLLPQGRVILEYLRLAVWPAGQSLDHGWLPGEHAAASVPSLVGVGALLLASGISAVAGRRVLGWAGLAFFLVLAPSSGLVPVRDFLAEHRMYLGLAVCCAVAVIAADGLLRRAVPSAAARRVVACTLLVAAAGALAARTVARNELYGSGAAMWADVVRGSPGNPRAHHNLGLALLDSTAPDSEERALAQFLLAIEARPDHRHAHNNAATVLRRRGDLMRAEQHFAAAVAAGDDRFVLSSNHGAVLLELGRVDAARRAFERARARLEHETQPRSDVARLHNNLGVCATRLDDPDAAEQHFRRSTEVDPALDEAWANLVRTLAAADRWDAAVAAAEAACAVAPASVARKLQLLRVSTLRESSRR